MRTLYSIGLMSGSSLDALDGVLIRAVPKGRGYSIRTLAHRRVAYPVRWSALAREIADRNLLREAHLFGIAWSEVAARLVRRLAHHADVPLSRISGVGAHGQTVVHLPRSGLTIQLADISRLAVRTGCTVVGNFRTADIAVGGEGAPLAPHAHRLLFASRKGGVAVQNMGGIGNVTLLRNGKVDCAFDTGPANAWLDAVARLKSGGRQVMDRNGTWARRGRPDAKCVERLLAHPYFRKRPPKSTGWEEFGAASLAPIARRLRTLSREDAMATVTDATVRSLRDAYDRFVFPRGSLRKCIVAGGGAKNLFLMEELARVFPDVRVTTSREYGVEVDQLEAVAFALLALETLRGRPSNQPRATGARRATICGEVAFGGHPQRPLLG